MFNKHDAAKVGTAASYTFAAIMAIILGVNSLDLRIKYSQSQGPDWALELKEPSAHIFIFTILPMGIALGVKIPPEVIARLMGVKVPTTGNDEEP